MKTEELARLLYDSPENRNAFENGQRYLTLGVIHRAVELLEANRGGETTREREALALLREWYEQEREIAVASFVSPKDCGDAHREDVCWEREDPDGFDLAQRTLRLLGAPAAEPARAPDGYVVRRDGELAGRKGGFMLSALAEVYSLDRARDFMNVRYPAATKLEIIPVYFDAAPTQPAARGNYARELLERVMPHFHGGSALEAEARAYLAATAPTQPAAPPEPQPFDFSTPKPLATLERVMDMSLPCPACNSDGGSCSLCKGSVMRRLPTQPQRELCFKTVQPFRAQCMLDKGHEGECSVARPVAQQDALAEFVAAQQPLEPEVAEVLNANRWDLYETVEPQQDAGRLADRLEAEARRYGTKECPAFMDREGRLATTVGVEDLRALLDEAARALRSARDTGQLQDDPELDATDFAHPAWWRGEEHGVEMTVRALMRVLDEGHQGTFGSPALETLAQRLSLLRDTEQRLRDALEQAARWFDAYALHHLDKGDEEKAERNWARAAACRRALAATED